MRIAEVFVDPQLVEDPSSGLIGDMGVEEDP